MTQLVNAITSHNLQAPSVRNAAKARIRDGTTRAEKSHFGKQRILAAGLGRRSLKSTSSGVRSQQVSLVEKIELAHARRDPKFVSRFTCSEHRRRDDEAPEDAIVSLAISLETLASRESPTRQKRSAILRELDFTERM